MTSDVESLTFGYRAFFAIFMEIHIKMSSDASFVAFRYRVFFVNFMGKSIKNDIGCLIHDISALSFFDLTFQAVINDGISAQDAIQLLLEKRPSLRPWHNRPYVLEACGNWTACVLSGKGILARPMETNFHRPSSVESVREECAIMKKQELAAPLNVIQFLGVLFEFVNTYK